MPTLTPITEYAELVKEQHALNKTIAPVETDLTGASQAYAKGAKFIYDGIMYQAKTAIAQHDALVLNTNYEAAPDVETQIANEAAVRSQMGAKNLMPFDLDNIKALNTNGTWASNVYSYRGVDFTVNPDGTILADGQATGGNASIKVFAATSSYEMLGKNVILNGCPSGGSATTYRIQAYRMGSADGATGTYFDDGDGTIAFDALNNASGTVGSFAVAVYENYDADNLLFKPMVRLATDSDGTYQPYAKTNKELTDEVNSQNTAIANEVETRAKLGAHNRLPLDLATIKSLNTSGTWSGNAYTVNNVTFTVNDDFTITANTSGAASATAFLALASNIVFKAEDYILSAGSSIDGQYSKYGLYLQRTGQSDITTADETKKHFVLSTDTVFTNCKIFVVNGESVTNLVFKPMVTLASDPYTEYTPYVPTNAELLSADTNAVLGAHNLLPNVGTTNTKNGVTATYASDGTLTLNASSPSTASTDFPISPTEKPFYLKEGTYILSGGVSEDARLYIRTIASVSAIVIDNGNGAEFTVTSEMASGGLAVYLNIVPGKTFSNVVMKPMIRLASDPSTAYAPYAMTNRELTEDIKGNEIFEGSYTISTTSDGAKTCQALLYQLATDLKTLLASLKNNEYIVISSAEFDGYIVINAEPDTKFDKSSSSITSKFMRLMISAKVYMETFAISSAALGSNGYLEMALTPSSPVPAISNFAEVVGISGRTWSITYKKYLKV